MRNSTIETAEKQRRVEGIDLTSTPEAKRAWERYSQDGDAGELLFSVQKMETERAEARRTLGECQSANQGLSAECVRLRGLLASANFRLEEATFLP